MINQRQKILLLIVSTLGVAKAVGLNAIAKDLQNDSKLFLPSSINSNFISYPFYAQARGPCEQLGQNHKKVHGFLTHNFHIGICLQGDQFYYYRHSKSNPKQVILLKATTVMGGKVFKATKGRVTYFVGTNANGYYSSVMQANHEIVVEHEVKYEKFNPKIQKILNRSPISTESNLTLDYICNIKDGHKTDDNVVGAINKNSEREQTKQKDAILYSSSCL